MLCYFRFKVKPEPLANDQTNYLYNYRVMGKTWGSAGRKRAFEDKRALIGDTPTSQLSLSSGSADCGYGGEMTEIGNTEKQPGDVKDGSSGTSGIGTSQGDLRDEAYMETEVTNNGEVFLGTNPNGKVARNSPSDSNNSDQVPSTNSHLVPYIRTKNANVYDMQSKKSPLPILSPIKSTQDTLYSNDHLEPENLDHLPKKSPRMLEPLTNIEISESKKKRKKKRRKPIPEQSGGEDVALKPLSTSTYITVVKLPPINQGKGESNA